ncbi:hypothetical protein BU23DRAFT_471998, partial [Bimuria novae-zelandiae CBS 107.79]
KINRLVRSAVSNQSSKDTQKLRQSLYHLSIKNKLLKHDNDRLRQALSIKKKRNKKSKALDL